MSYKVDGFRVDVQSRYKELSRKAEADLAAWTLFANTWSAATADYLMIEREKRYGRTWVDAPEQDQAKSIYSDGKGGCAR